MKKINNKKKSEIQLFVIWELGRYAEKDIIQDLADTFEVIQTFSITWSPYMVHQNFTRFYDTKLPRNSQKETYAGGGEFKLIVVRDNTPNYDYRITSKGRFFVNTKMFDSKAKYRDLTGGGHKIHGTNDNLELKHDIVMLLGLSLSDFLNKYDNPNETNIDIALAQDLPGTIGWKSFDELFYVLNECDEYVVLRNSDNISLQYYQKNKGDIDLLVTDRNRCQYLLGDLSCLDSENKEDSKVSVNNQVIYFELYESGKNLFDEKYENHLFKNKVLKNNIYCLPNELEFYTLVYHAIFFHKKLTNKHFDKITACIKELEKFQTIKVTQRSLVSLLLDFFSIKKYSFIAPNDSSIYFNFNLLKGENLLIQNKKRSSVFRIYLSKVIQIKSFKKYLKITFLSFLSNEIDIVFSFRFRFLMKEIRFCLGNRRKYKY